MTKRFVLSILLLASLVPFLNLGAASSIDHLSNQYKKLGEGKLTWFGFSVYQSSLYSQSGQFTNLKEARSVMLVIQYLRDIDKKDLIDRTLKEWRDIPGLSTDKFEGWLNTLHTIWPEIKENDKLACVINADGSTTFYSQNNALGTIRDTDFGWNFLSIWLSKHTSEKKLRKKLLGLNK